MNGAPPLPILLVEDDPDLAANIQDYLEGQGWAVDHAPNGALAIHKLIEGKFSAGVFDLNLPGLGGLELCARVRASIAPSLPVLILTAADALEDRLRGFQAGADDYLINARSTPGDTSADLDQHGVPDSAETDAALSGHRPALRT